MRCLLNSYNAQQKWTSVRGAVATALLRVPTPWGGPDTPEGFKAKILAAAAVESSSEGLGLAVTTLPASQWTSCGARV